MGGAGEDYCKGIAIDSAGNIYVTGGTDSPDFQTTIGANDTTLNGNEDVFVMKFNSEFELIYSTYFGGDQSDRGRSLAVDNVGNVYVVGDVYSPGNIPTTDGANDTTHNGQRDIFVFKLNVDGSWIEYCTYIGGSQDDFPQSIAVDDDGSAYITGYTYSNDFPTYKANDTTLDGSRDAFVVKVSPDGSWLDYSTYLGGSQDDSGSDIVVDGNGSAYVVGETSSTDFPTTSGVFNTSHNGGWNDGFAVRTNGSWLNYSTYIGADQYDTATSCDVSDGELYVSGFGGENFPITNGSWGVLTQGEYVMRINRNASTILNATIISDLITIQDIRLSGGSVHLTGDLLGTIPVTDGAYDVSWNGEEDGYLLILDGELTSLLYGSYLGGSGPDSGVSLAIHGDKVYVVGNTFAYPPNSFPTTFDAFDRTPAGDGDGFLSVFLPVIQESPSYIEGINGYNYYVGDTGNTISWTVHDPLVYRPFYVVYRNGIEITSGDWVSGEEIEINIDGLSAGVYTFRIETYDGIVEQLEHEVTIFVQTREGRPGGKDTETIVTEEIVGNLVMFLAFGGVMIGVVAVFLALRRSNPSARRAIRGR
jgi:hypothetical protein